MPSPSPPERAVAQGRRVEPRRRAAPLRRATLGRGARTPIAVPRPQGPLRPDRRARRADVYAPARPVRHLPVSTWSTSRAEGNARPRRSWSDIRTRLMGTIFTVYDADNGRRPR